MVSANDLKNCPTMPVMKPTGRNTARIVKVVAMTARPISAVPLRAAVNGILAVLHVAVDVLAHDDRVVDQDADDERQRHQRHHVDGEADRPHEEERRDHGRRQRERGDQRRAPVAHEDEDDEHGHQAAEEDVIADVATFSLMKSASLWTGRICSGGKLGASRASVASTRSAISTVLAPDCLRTENDTASAPFRRVVDVLSS